MRVECGRKRVVILSTFYFLLSTLVIKVEIDATNETLGRLASKIAVFLRGKNLASYQPEVQPQIEVQVKNADKVRFTGSKFNAKIYYHYSGYHSGIRARKLSELWARGPTHVIKECVYR